MIQFRKIRGEDSSYEKRIGDLERQCASIIEVAQSNILNLEKTMASLKTEISSLKTEISSLKTEISSIKAKLT